MLAVRLQYYRQEGCKRLRLRLVPRGTLPLGSPEKYNRIIRENAEIVQLMHKILGGELYGKFFPDFLLPNEMRIVGQCSVEIMARLQPSRRCLGQKQSLLTFVIVACC